MKKIINISLIAFLSLVSCKNNTDFTSDDKDRSDNYIVTLHLDQGKIDDRNLLVLTLKQFKELNEYPKYEGHIFTSYYVDKYFYTIFDENFKIEENLDLYAKYTEDIYEYQINNNEVTIVDVIDEKVKNDKIIVPDYLLEKKVTRIKEQSFSNLNLSTLDLNEIEYIEKDSFYNSTISYLKIGDTIENIEYGAFRNIKYLYSVEIEDNLKYSAVNNVILEKNEGNQRTIIGYYSYKWKSMFNEQDLTTIDVVEIAPYSFTNIYVKEKLVPIKDDEGNITGYNKSPGGFTLYIPSTIEKLNESSFEDCKVYRFDENENEIEIELGAYFFKGTKEIGKNAFKNSSISLIKYETKKENDVVVPYGEGVEIFKEGAFMENKNIKEFTLPKTLKKIEKDCFKNCDNLKTIFYEGTKEEYQNIVIEEGNEALNNVEVLYFSKEKVENGWFYDENTVSKPIRY